MPSGAMKHSGARRPSAASGPSVAFLQSTNDTSDLSTYTFSSQNFGTASADRRIIVATTARAAGSTALTITGITIGGVTASIPVQYTAGSTNKTVIGLAIAAVPSGGSGNVVVTFSRSCLRCIIPTYRATGLASATPHDSDSGTGLSTSATEVPAGGFLIAAAAVAQNTTFTWSGLTEDFDNSVEAFLSISTASGTFASTTTPTVTATPGGSLDSAFVAASWS